MQLTEFELPHERIRAVDRGDEIVNDGIESEADDQENTEIDHPFNPEKIKVRPVQLLVQQLVTRIGHEEIDLAPDFQRLRGIWNDNRKSRLIESLLLRIPIPVFYVSADERDNWAVVDGVQRMSTIYEFSLGKFAFKGLEYLTDFNGKFYDELPRNMLRRIEETQLTVNVIEPGTPVEVMFNIFHRINTGGMRLNGQEIRHALNPGPVRAFLQELAQTEEFLIATDNSIKATRMADRECVLRFLAFYVRPWRKYRSNDLDGYLVETMKNLNRMNQGDRDRLKEKFKKAMRAATDIFNVDAFRKRTAPDHMRNPVNKALFEAWSVVLAKCSPEEIESLVECKADVRKQFMELLNEDKIFQEAVSVSTGVPQRVQKRFDEIQKLVECYF